MAWLPLWCLRYHLAVAVGLQEKVALPQEWQPTDKGKGMHVGNATETPREVCGVFADDLFLRAALLRVGARVSQLLGPSTPLMFPDTRV